MSTEQVAEELDKIEKNKNDLIGRYTDTLLSGIERTKLRVKSLEDHLDHLKKSYEQEKAEVNKSLAAAVLVLNSLEAARDIVVVPAPADELSDVLKNQAANRRKVTRVRRK